MRIGGVENVSIFYLSQKLSNLQKLFLLHPHENQSTFIGQHGWVEILIITLVFSSKQHLCTFLHTTVCTAKNLIQFTLQTRPALNIKGV